MRWLAFIVLGLNLAVWYFAGALQPPGRSPLATGGSLPRVASLKSDELDRTVDVGAETVSAESEGQAYPEGEAEPELIEQPEVQVSMASEPVPESIPDSDAETPAPSAQQVQVSSGEQDAVVAEETAPPSDEEVEQVSALPAPSDIAPEGIEVTEVAEPELRVCVKMGWIETRDSAEQLVQSQTRRAEEARLVVLEEERELPPFNWIIIPPQPRAEALRQFREIQRRGIDSYLVTEGENRNAISLGLFESREAAISVLEEKKRQNLNAVLANFPRNQISYALAFEGQPALVEELVPAVEADYGSKFDFIEINPCEGVATPKKNP